MNKQDKEKAVEISGHYLQIVDCFAKTQYDEDDILSTARDAAMEMAAWKEQQMIEKATNFIKEKVSDYFLWNVEECFVDFDNETCLDDFRKYMEENK